MPSKPSAGSRTKRGRTKACSLWCTRDRRRAVDDELLEVSAHCRGRWAHASSSCGDRALARAAQSVPKWTEYLEQGVILDTVEISAAWDKIGGIYDEAVRRLKLVPGCVETLPLTRHTPIAPASISTSHSRFCPRIEKNMRDGLCRIVEGDHGSNRRRGAALPITTASAAFGVPISTMISARRAAPTSHSEESARPQGHHEPRRSLSRCLSTSSPSTPERRASARS